MYIIFLKCNILFEIKNKNNNWSVVVKNIIFSELNLCYWTELNGLMLQLNTDVC